jgi:hypothetical protein
MSVPSYSDPKKVPSLLLPSPANRVSLSISSLGRLSLRPSPSEYQSLIQDSPRNSSVFDSARTHNSRSVNFLNSLSNFNSGRISSSQYLKNASMPGSTTDVKLTTDPENSTAQAELEGYLEVKMLTDFEKIDKYMDRWPLLDFRKVFVRIKCFISDFLRLFISSAIFQFLVITVIFFNTVVLALEDPKWVTMPPPYDSIEFFFACFYTSEFVMIVVAKGLFLNTDSYFREWWNLLDFTILVAAWLSIYANSGFNLSALRSLRILRPLRSISSVKGMKGIINSLISSIKPLISALFILFFFVYIFAVAAVQLWMGSLRGRCLDLNSGVYDAAGVICGSQNCENEFTCVQALDNPNFGVTHHDNILISFVTVFQI